jgi:2-iminobutanoate/2-iminopropanoate deaminase
VTLRAVSTDAAPKPVAAYSQGIVAGGFLFTAGQIGLDPATNALVEGLDAQVERALENVRAVLAAQRLTVADLVKVTVYVTDLSKFAAINAIYERFLGSSRPARTTVGVAALPGGALFEVDAIALCRQ